MVFRRKKKQKLIAEWLACEFGGRVKFSGSSLNDSLFTIQMDVESLQISAHTHDTYIRLCVDKFHPPRPIFCSVGGPSRVDGLTLARTREGMPSTLEVFACPGHGDESVSAVDAMLSDDRNIVSLEAMRVGKDEHLLFFNGQIELKQSMAHRELLPGRIAVLSEMFHRLVGPETKTILCEQPRPLQAVPRRAHPEPPPSAILCHGGGAVSSMPLCRNCNIHMQRIARIDMKASGIDVSGMGDRHIEVPACLNCDAISSPCFIRVSGEGMEILDQAKGQSFADFTSPLEQYWFVAASRHMDSDDQGSEPKHQIGGKPSWVQSSYVPRCFTCGKYMAFLAQFDTDSRVDLQFEDDGMLYVFLCVQCEVMATFAQSH